ncbi:DUF11 domain-containing protein [bacterium]|nr:DUF11 domain-containing protein [bacterium]
MLFCRKIPKYIDLTPFLFYDIDTFLLQYDENDTSGLINKHIEYGTTSIWFLIGSGADIVLTNYVMLSVDTKLPAFDIPDVDEKQLLTGSTDNTLACDDRPFAYEIRVENHGSEPAVNVMVQDELPSALKYTPASTQIDRTGSGTCYEPLGDIAGESPLQNGVKVADNLEICQNETTCPSILLRFKVEPMQPPKHAMYSNIAKIWDDKSTLKYAYLTNQNLAVRTKVDFDCAETTKELYTPESTACGGAVVVPDDDNESQDDSVDDVNTDNETDPQTDDDIPPFEDEGCGCNLVF